MLLNVDQLQKQLDKDEFQEDGSMAAFWVVNNQFQKFIDSQFTLDYDSQITDKYFVKYTRIEVKHFKDTILQHMGNVKKSVAERTRHQRQYDRRVNKRQMQTQESKIDMGKAVDVDLVVTESSGIESEVQDDSSRSGNDTDADDAYIRPIYEEEPMTEVQLTVECNIFVIGQQNTEQPEIINEVRVDQYPEQRQVKSHMLDSSPENQTTDYSKQSLESLKSRQHGQILNETSNKAKIEKEIDVLETMNFELEHSVAKLRKENKTLKKHYKDLYDSIKTTRSKTIEHTTSLLANNADLKAQIQEKESAFAKPDHMIASSSSRNSSKNMPRFSSNDMVHNHYLDEAKKKTQERDRNSKTSVMPSARFQCTADDSKPKPRSKNQTPRSLPISKSSCVTISVVPKADHSKNSSSFSDSKHFVCSTCHKCVFNANHDACITKLLKEIFTGHRFSPNKTSVVYEKTSPRSDLRWKPTGRIFKSVGLRWIPTGKTFDSCTGKVDSELTHGSNVDIPNIHVCKQTLDLSACTSLNGQKQQRIDLSAYALYNVKQENLRVWLLKKLISQKPHRTITSTEVPTVDMIELESLFSPLFDEYFNGVNQLVSKSSAVTTTDASNKRQQQPDSTSSTSTLATTVTANGNFDLTTHVQHSKLIANFKLKCVKCNGCMLSDNHGLCVLDFINNVNARTKSKSVKKNSKRKVWKPTRKVFTNIGYIWRPTGRTFTIVGNACALTRITTTTEVPLRKPTALNNETSKSVVTLVYSRKPRKSKTNVPVSKSKVVQIVLCYLDSGCSKHMTGDRSRLTNFVNKFLGIVKFGNDHVAKILGYGDYQIGNVTISRVYYVEGLGHNLFFVGQFCDSNLEVAFRQHICFIHNLEGVDLLTGSRGNNLYTLSLRDMMASSPICLLSKDSKTKSWLWHRRLSHLNFGAINYLARHGLVRGLPKIKFEKDHLCSACAMGKSKKKPHKPKSEDTDQEKLYLLHMDLCGPMRVTSVNGKMYILVIVDD
ncbi:retrovirus-related pol polyprotein from transposon TNT 1-94 [Tanacetum coccineum]